MKWVQRIAFLFIVSLLLMPMISTDAKAQSTRQQLKELKQQMEEMQRQHQQQMEALQQKIEVLENARMADQEQMDAVKESVKENEDAWYNQFKAKYKKGLTFESKDKNFKMKMRLRGQFRATIDQKDNRDPETSTNFSVQRLRIKWDGHAFRPWFLYTVQLGAKDSVTLRDMYFTFAYNKSFAPRVGQFKVPFGRQELNSSSALQFVDRSIVNDEFGWGRDRGMVILGGLGPMYNFSYSGGVFNGDGRNGKSVDSNMLYAGRLQVGFGGEGDKFKANSSFATGSAYSITPNFAKKPTFTFGAAIGGIPGLDCDRKTPDNDVCDRMQGTLGTAVGDVITITGDVNFKMPIFNVQGSYYGRWIDPDISTQDRAYDQGFNIQTGVFLMPKTIEVAGRFSYIDYDTSAGILPPDAESVQDTVWTLTPAFSYYISKDHRWKIQLDYTYKRREFTNGAPDVNENQFRAQLQAYF